MPDFDITLIIDGAIYDCVPRDEQASLAVPWHFPVGDGGYPPELWYCATWHDLTGARNNGYKHTGIDINLDVSPWGDVERELDLCAYAVADGVVTYSTPNWSGVPMVVIRHEHEGEPLWVRYAHIATRRMVGDSVISGGYLGLFANCRTGDHLHFDMALDPFTREWLDPSIRWIDPVPVLKAHLDPAMVDAMLRKG